MTRNTTTALEQLHSDLLKDSVESLWNIEPQRFIHIQRCFTMFRNLKITFKIISVLSLVLLTTFFLKPDVALAGGFDKTCSNIRVDKTETELNLIATCKKRNGKTADSRLDISKYIANRNGELSWLPGEGGFLKTCESITFFGDYLHLNAYCKSVPRPLISKLYLPDYISNLDGVLTPDRRI